ncbi:hypothetical protein [Streptococcus pneumoniae]|uniref:hypothetical protein n=1 Tax=Streptococcus pneumoniae TaxID=1313 RepID=UPI00067C7B44|nr:hypothetical protein [Streptococcus pneumoniae]
MKIKEQTKQLVAGCSKYCFEVVDRTDEYTARRDEVSNQYTVGLTRRDEVSNQYTALTQFEEIFEEY